LNSETSYDIIATIFVIKVKSGFRNEILSGFLKTKNRDKKNYIINYVVYVL